MATRKEVIEEVVFRNSAELRQLIVAGKSRPYGRPIREIEADLNRELPFEMISWMPGRKNGDPIPHMAWPDVAMLLTFYAPGWSKELKEGQLISVAKSGIATAQCGIAIPAAEGTFIRWANGWDDDVDSMAYGGPVPMAESKGFCRAAATWGIFAYGYEAEQVERLVRELKSEERKTPKGMSWYDLAQAGKLNRLIGRLTNPLPPPPNSQLVHEGTMAATPTTMPTPVPPAAPAAPAAPVPLAAPAVVPTSPGGSTLLAPDLTPTPTPTPTPTAVASPTATASTTDQASAKRKQELKTQFIQHMQRLGVERVKPFWEQWTQAYQIDGTFPFVGKKFDDLSVEETEEVLRLFSQRATPGASPENDGVIPF